MSFSKRNAALLVSLLVIVGLMIYFVYWDVGNDNIVILGPENDGDSVVVEKGDEVLINISENPSTGYRWKFDLEEDFAKLLDNEYVPSENQDLGEEGIRKIKLKIISDGNFSMQYIRPWENSIENKFSVAFMVRN